MKRIIFWTAVLIGMATLSRRARVLLPSAMEHMMETVMPGMMDMCFAQMSPQRREFMLAHCRGMLDRVEEKYVKAGAA